PEWKGHRSTDKRYSGDNRLISPKSSHRRGGLAPRCRLIASWGWSRSQGVGCSPIKAVRELGLERRETVRSLSDAGVGGLRGAAPSGGGRGWRARWVASSPARRPEGKLGRGGKSSKATKVRNPPQDETSQGVSPLKAPGRLPG